jgi:hypothetical protein
MRGPVAVRRDLADDPSSSSSRRLKLHTNEGFSRGRSDAMLPTELAALSDRQLEDRNVRVWAVVLADCQRAAGLEPNPLPKLRAALIKPGPGSGQGSRPSTHAMAMRAALQIANTRYGIPAARLAKLIERTPSDTARYIRDVRPEADAIKSTWLERGGPERIEAAATTRQVDVAVHVHNKLSREAARRGVSIEVLVARLTETLR